MVGAGQFFVDGSVKLQYSSPSRQSIIVARRFHSMLYCPQNNHGFIVYRSACNDMFVEFDIRHSWM